MLNYLSHSVFILNAAFRPATLNKVNDAKQNVMLSKTDIVGFNAVKKTPVFNHDLDRVWAVVQLPQSVFVK